MWGHGPIPDIKLIRTDTFFFWLWASLRGVARRQVFSPAPFSFIVNYVYKSYVYAICIYKKKLLIKNKSSLAVFVYYTDWFVRSATSADALEKHVYFVLRPPIGLSLFSPQTLQTGVLSR